MPEENTPRQSISTEGKIGIGLTLLFGVGGGAIMVAPQQVWIGWTIIVFSFICLVILGIYHVSSAVAPAKAKPRPTPPQVTPPMNAADAGFLVACAAAVAAIIAVLSQYRVTAIIAAFVACFAVVADFADRHLSADVAAVELPLDAENARLDVIRWQPIINDQKQFSTNIFLANNGKKTISEWTFDGSTMTAPPGLLDNDLRDGIFVVLHRKIKAQPITKMDFNPGQSDQYISMPNVPPFAQLDDNTLEAYKNGSFSIYVLLLLQYKDGITPGGKHIYGERCVFVTQGTVHVCDNHNHNYIAD